jgi:hypothetical protein
MRALALIATLALATPALAQLPDMTPRSPIQAEQERRMMGHGFEQQQRTNPQLYPYPPSPPVAPIPPAPSLAPLAPPPPGPIPPETHLHSHRPAKPPQAADKPPPVPKEKPPANDTSEAPPPAPEGEKAAP